MYRPSAAGCGMQVPSRRCERGICKKNSSTLNSPRLIRLPLTFQVLFEPCRGSIQLFPIKMSNLQSASLAPHVLHVDGFGFPFGFGMSPCAIRQHSATADELISSQAKALHCNGISCATSTSQCLYVRVSALIQAEALDQRGLVQRQVRTPARLVQRSARHAAVLVAVRGVQSRRHPENFQKIAALPLDSRHDSGHLNSQLGSQKTKHCVKTPLRPGPNPPGLVPPYKEERLNDVQTSKTCHEPNQQSADLNIKPEARIPTSIIPRRTTARTGGSDSHNS